MESLIETKSVDELPQAKALSDGDRAIVKQDVTGRVNLGTVKTYMQGDLPQRINSAINETKGYVDQLLSGRNEWLPPVNTTSQLKTSGLDKKINYLCKVVADPVKSGVYQAVSGWAAAPQWELFNTTVDFVNEQELASGISTHNTNNAAHSDIRGSVTAEAQARQAAVEAEAQARAGAVSAEAVAREEAIEAEAEERGRQIAEAVSNEATNRNTAISNHNLNTSAHNDIRAAINGEAQLRDEAIAEAIGEEAQLREEAVADHDKSPTAHIDIRNIISNHIGLPAWDSENYVITFRAHSGATLAVNIPRETLSGGLDFDPETNEIIIAGGEESEIRIDVAALIPVYDGSIGDHIQIAIEPSNIITATLLEESIDEEILSIALQDKINGKVDKITPITEELTPSAKKIAYNRQGQITDTAGLTKADLGLGNVTNDAQVKRAEMGLADGVATLDTLGKVPSSQLPSNIGGGKKYATLVVGTSLAGHTLADVDYLCDGTDDQEEINAAIQALPASGGKVVIREWTYGITARIEVNRNNVTIEGMGASTNLRRMYNESGNGGLLHATGSSVAIRNLGIAGNNGSYASNSNYGIHIGGLDCMVSGCMVIDCANNGIFVSGSNCTVTGNTCNGNNNGIFVSGSSCTVTGNTCNGNTNNGIFVSGSSCTVTGNACNGNTNNGIFVSGNCTVTGNACNGNGGGIYAGSSCTVTGNTCNGNTTNGIGIGVNGSNCTVTGNTCNGNNNGIGVNGSNCTVTGNTCIRGTGTAGDYTPSQNTIQTASTATNNLITGNNIMGKNYVNSGGASNTFANNKYN